MSNLKNKYLKYKNKYLKLRQHIDNTTHLKFTLLTHLVLLRGILAPNCKWYDVSDQILSDGAGVNLYNSNKKKYGDFVPINMFGRKL